MSALRVRRSVWICLTIWLSMTAYFLHNASHSEQTLVNQPTERWAVELSAGCPPHLASPSPDSDIDAQLARPLSAAELLCRPLASDHSSIPKLLHQSWKTNELPAKFDKWSRVCREKHQDWDHGSDILLIILPSVYVDLDTDCLRPTSTAFDAFSITTSENATASADAEQVNQFAVFGRMGTDESFENSISNAWMASSPGHPFSHAPTVCANPDRKEQIEWTGPAALYRAILDFNTNGLSQEAAALAAVGPFASQTKKTKQEIVLLPSHWIYPYDWTVKAFSMLG
ncbi:hypothetical protein ACLOAV_009130 [Pseudogymnoascus australis]